MPAASATGGSQRVGCTGDRNRRMPPARQPSPSIGQLTCSAGCAKADPDDAAECGQRKHGEESSRIVAHDNRRRPPQEQAS